MMPQSCRGARDAGAGPPRPATPLTYWQQTASGWEKKAYGACGADCRWPGAPAITRPFPWGYRERPWPSSAPFRSSSRTRPGAIPTGAINQRFEQSGLKIVAQKRVRLTEGIAERFYAVHAERPFYRSLVGSMISGPVVVQVLEGEGAVAKNREVMGATDPAKAAPGTIRKDFAESIEANSVHGSDSPENAAQEIAFFFSRSIEIAVPFSSAATKNLVG